MQFVNLAIQFAYGPDVDIEKVAAIQTLSGTGACRIGGEFYSRFLPKGTKIYIPEPTWGNHIAIYQNCGLDVQRYRYYDYTKNVRRGIICQNCFLCTSFSNTMIRCILLFLIYFRCYRRWILTGW